MGWWYMLSLLGGPLTDAMVSEGGLLMKFMTITVLLLPLLYSQSFSQACTNSLTLECPPANNGEGVWVPVRVTNCSSTIDSLEFDVYFFDLDVQFYTVDKAGTLLEDWTSVVGSVIWPGGARITAFDAGGGFGPVEDELLITLYFEVVTTSTKHSSIRLTSLRGDIIGFEIQDCMMSVPNKQSTWGHVKSFYE